MKPRNILFSIVLNKHLLTELRWHSFPLETFNIVVIKLLWRFKISLQRQEVLPNKPRKATELAMPVLSSGLNKLISNGF